MSLFAQKQDYSTSNREAIRLYEQAFLNYKLGLWEKSSETIKASLGKDSTFIEAWLLLGDLSVKLDDFEQSANAYGKAVQINSNYFPNATFGLANAEFRTGKYEAAKIDFEKFLNFEKISGDLRERAKELINYCDFSIEGLKHPVTFKPINLGDSINSVYKEYFPCITADGSTFIFTRRVPKTGKRDKEDFYISHWVSNANKGYWTKAKPIDELNTEGNEGAPNLSADGQYLFFIGCEEEYGYPEGRDEGEGLCDVYISKKKGDKYGKARNLGPPINTKNWESQPSFSSDGRTLYFVRALKGHAQHDIYVSFIDDSSRWSEPEPLPSNINTPFDEMTVFIHPDDQTLYFSSNGHPGFGGMDIFMSKRNEDGSWGDPINLGYPINTSADDNSLLVSPDGQTAFFASNRADSRGGLDLYQFELPESAQPKKITYMKGKVFDAETKKPLGGNFELIDLETAKPVVRSTSNEVNGEFIVPLPSGKRYALNVSRDGYLFYSDNFELKDPASVDKPFLKDVPLKPIKAGESVVLKNIFYEVDKFDLKEESQAELGKIIQFLKKNPKVRVEVGGHTDNTGSKQHNQELSEKRAQAVLNYLASIGGVDELRLTYKGYADTKPIAPNTTEAGRAQNRRTEFTIVAVE